MVYYHVYWTRDILRSRHPLISPTVLCPPGGSRESHQMRAPHSGEPLSRPPTNCQKTPTNLMVVFSGANSYSGSPNGEWPGEHWHCKLKMENSGDGLWRLREQRCKLKTVWSKIHKEESSCAKKCTSRKSRRPTFFNLTFSLIGSKEAPTLLLLHIWHQDQEDRAENTSNT